MKYAIFVLLTITSLAIGEATQPKANNAVAAKNVYSLKAAETMQELSTVYFAPLRPI